MSSRHQLPLPQDKITGLGYNPLKEEWMHKDLGGPALYMQYAWDFRVPKGTLIYPTMDGKAIDVRVGSGLEATKEQLKAILDNPGDPELDMLAVRLYKANNRIIVEHPDGTYSHYAHLVKDGSLVEVGNNVVIGQPIGYSGNTGFSSDPHLHFEIYRPHEGVNPVMAIDGPEGRGNNARYSINPDFDKKTMEFLKRLAGMSE